MLLCPRSASFLTVIVLDFVGSASCWVDCLTSVLPLSSSVSPQFVLNVARWPVQTRVSVATASAWAAARNPTTTWRAPPASTTTTRAAACRTAPRAPTSSRAGAASPWTCALKSTYLATLSLSSTGENACLNAPPASHATRQISKDVPFPSESRCCF